MDISVEEEAHLPLPKNWIRIIKHDGSVYYKSTVTVVETDEHPFVVQALNSARKCVLPVGWVINETTSSDGHNDYYYCNPALGLSMWDPPALRSCLADCLRTAGFHAAADRIISMVPAGAQIQTESHKPEFVPSKLSNSHDIGVTYQQFRLQQQMLAESKPGASSIVGNNADNSNGIDLRASQQQWLSLRPEENRYGGGVVHSQPVSMKNSQSFMDTATANRTQTMQSMTAAVSVASNSNFGKPVVPVKASASVPVPALTPPSPQSSSVVDDEVYEQSDVSQQPATASPTRMKMPVYIERAVKPTLDELTQDASTAQPLSANFVTANDATQGNAYQQNQEDEDDYSDTSSDTSSDSSETSDSEALDREHAQLLESKSNTMISPENEIIFHTQEIRNTITPYFKADKWGWSTLAINRLSTEIAELEAAYAPVTYRIKKSKPPITTAGIKLLIGDVCSTNERMHQLLLLLRSKLNARNSIHCRTIHTKAKYLNEIQTETNSRHENIKSHKDLDYVSMADHLCTAAGEIIHVLREYPVYCIEIISYFSLDQTNMSLVSYLLLNRLLHPFSCDSSLTTALLLEAVNMQMAEMSHIEQIFPDLDGHALMSRALFIRDPHVALCWNPLAQPLPVAPMINNDTTLGTILKAYAIRRDVTSYFRLIWKPMFPSILVLSNKGEMKSGGTTSGTDHTSGTTADATVSSSTVLADIFAVAVRILELTLKPSVITAFPPGATAVCRALYMIAGIESVQIYLLNYLLLPNLMKVLLYESDSVDNEEDIYFSSTHRDDFNINTTSDVTMNKFYNLNTWWPAEGYTATNFKPNHAVLWQIWRIFTGAAFLNNVTITVMTSAKFFGDGPQMSARDIPEQRLRNILFRLKSQINKAVEILVKIPLDARANEILGIEPYQIKPEEAAKATHSKALIEGIPAKYWIKRLESLVIKPAHMNQMSLFSRHELAILLEHLLSAMEDRAATNAAALAAGRKLPPVPPGVPSTSAEESPLYDAIKDFLAVNQLFDIDGQSNADELITVPLQNDGQLATEMKRDVVFERYFGTSETSNTNAGIQVAGAKGKATRRGSSAGVAHVSTDSMQSADRETMVNQRLFRYDQLCRGLRLLERYEDSVVGMLKKVEQGRICTMQSLMDDSSWADNVDFDVDIKIEQFNTVVRHTKGSGKKTKKSHYGLRLARATNSMQLQEDNSAEFNQIKASGAVGSGTNHVSRSNLHQDFFASLRFGTAAVAANAGTSLARLASSPPPRQTTNRNYHPHARASSQDPYIINKQFLKPTEVVIMKNVVKEPETRHQREQLFQKSLRSPARGDTISMFDSRTDQSTAKRNGGGNRSRNSSISGVDNSVTSGSYAGAPSGRKQSALASMVPQRTAPSALPFPEHMRHRLRQQSGSDPSRGYDLNMDPRYDEYGNELIEMDEDFSVQSDFGGNPGQQGRQGGAIYDEAQSIISDFQALRGGSVGGTSHSNSGYYNQQSWNNENQRDNNRTGTVRSTPSGNYMAPTEAVMKKLATKRTVYDRTGAGFALRNFDVHIDQIEHKDYQFHHNEMPHGHPQGYNYANHPHANDQGYDDDVQEYTRNDHEQGVESVEQSRGRSRTVNNHDSRRNRTSMNNHTVSRSVSPLGESKSRSRSNSRNNSRSNSRGGVRHQTPPNVGFGTAAKGRMDAAPSANVHGLYGRGHGNENMRHRSPSPATATGTVRSSANASGNYMAPTEAVMKKLATKRTVYDRTGAGFALRNFDVHIDQIEHKDYQFHHNEMPHGHPQGYNYANHPRSGSSSPNRVERGGSSSNPSSPLHSPHSQPPVHHAPSQRQQYSPPLVSSRNQSSSVRDGAPVASSTAVVQPDWKHSSYNQVSSNDQQYAHLSPPPPPPLSVPVASFTANQPDYNMPLSQAGQYSHRNPGLSMNPLSAGAAGSGAGSGGAYNSQPAQFNNSASAVLPHRLVRPLPARSLLHVVQVESDDALSTAASEPSLSPSHTPSMNSSRSASLPSVTQSLSGVGGAIPSIPQSNNTMGLSDGSAIASGKVRNASIPPPPSLVPGLMSPTRSAGSRVNSITSVASGVSGVSAGSSGSIGRPLEINQSQAPLSPQVFYSPVAVISPRVSQGASDKQPRPVSPTQEELEAQAYARAETDHADADRDQQQGPEDDYQSTSSHTSGTGNANTNTNTNPAHHSTNPSSGSGNAYDEDKVNSSPISPSTPHKTLSRKHTWNKDALAQQLLTGVKAIKHGKSGKPKEKLFTYNPDRQQLQWTNAKTSLFTLLRKGSSRMMVSGDVDDTDSVTTTAANDGGTVDLKDFVEIKKGIHTEVSLKARASNKALDPLCFLSIITTSRTIDIQCASSKDRDLLFRSLQGICFDSNVKFS